MTHILVTGGNGFIGSHLVNALALTGAYRVTVLDMHPRPYDALPAGVTYVQSDLANSSMVRRVLSRVSIM